MTEKRRPRIKRSAIIQSRAPYVLKQSPQYNGDRESEKERNKSKNTQMSKGEIVIYKTSDSTDFQIEV